MAYALPAPPVRAVSVSISALAWAGALLALAIGGARVAEAPRPALPEPDAIKAEYLPEPPKPPTRTVAPRLAESPLEAPPMPVAAPIDLPLLADDVAPGQAGGVLFAEPAAPVASIVDPRWIQRPSDLARYYPARALAKNKTGEVLLDCLVDLNGRLGCAIVSETPQAWGFGAAALRMSRDYQMVPAMRDGKPVTARYAMRVPFQLD